MAMYGAKIVEGPHILPGHCVVMFDHKVVWWGTFAAMRNSCPSRFDTVHVHPDDAAKLREAVPRIPSQSGGGR